MENQSIQYSFNKPTYIYCIYSLFPLILSKFWICFSIFDFLSTKHKEKAVKDQLKASECPLVCNIFAFGTRVEFCIIDSSEFTNTLPGIKFSCAPSVI